MRRITALVFLILGLVQAAKGQQKDSSLLKMDELVISADRFEEKLRDHPRQIEIISKKQIQQLNKQNTADLLQETGNVFIQKSQQGGGSPIIRGFESNRVLLVLDGVRLNNAIYRSGHLQNVLRIDQNSLQKAEVLFGPGALMYGSDALGGVVHFVTQKPTLGSGLKGFYSVRYSNANEESTNSLGLSYAYKKYAWLGNYTQSNFGNLKQGKNRNKEMGTLGLRPFYQGRISNQDVTIINSDPSVQVGSGYQQENYHTKLLYQPNHLQQHIISLTGSKTSNVNRYDRLSETKKDTPVYGEWYYGPEKFLLLNYQFEDRRKTKISDQIRLVAAAQLIEESRMSRNFGSSNKTHRSEKVKVYTLNLDLKKQYQVHEIRYGFEYAFNQVSSSAYAENINTGAISLASTRYPDGGSNMSWLGIYINVNQEILSKWVLSEGVRINQTNLKSTFSDKTFYEFLPDKIEQKNFSVCGSLGLVYLAGKQSKIYANLGNAFRTPNVDDLGKVFDSKSGSAMIVPNNQLKPEQTLSGEIGTLFGLSNKVSVDANVFYTQLWDALIIGKTNINGVDQLLYDGKLTPIYSVQNAQKSFLYGYHTQVALLLPAHLKLQASINYTYGRILADSIMPLDHIAPLFGRTSLNYEHKKLQASLYIIYSGAKKLEDYYLNGEDNLQYATANGMPAWHTVNIQSTYKFTKKDNVLLSAGIENIFDKNYRVFSSGISSAGRNLWVNLKINF